MDLSDLENPTLADLLTALGKEQSNFTIENITIKIFMWGSVRTQSFNQMVCSNYTGNNYSYTFSKFGTASNQEFYKDIGSDDPNTVSLSFIMSPTNTYYSSPFNPPATSDLDAEKTYTLKFKDGYVQWVEETA